MKFSGSGCLGVRSRRVQRHVGRFKGGLCLRFNNGLFSSCRTSEILPKFRPSDGLHVLVRLSSRTRVIVMVDTTSVSGGGIENSLNVACSRSMLHLVRMFARHKLCIKDIYVARCSKRRDTSTFGGHLRGLKVGMCILCLVPNCPGGASFVMDSRKCNGGSCVRAAEPLIIVATPKPKDKGVTAYLSRLCRRCGHNIGTKCTGFRAFPV